MTAMPVTSPAAGSQSWKAFFFGSSDAANVITVDKPSAARWIMALSVRTFGLSSWSILVPASSRPHIGGSLDDSILELTLGYNGFGRMFNSEIGGVGGAAGGAAGGGGGGGGGQAGWLLVTGVVFGLMAEIALAITMAVTTAWAERRSTTCPSRHPG